MNTDRYLSIYLHDHHAGALAGQELSRRAQKNNPEGPLGEFLTRLVEEISQDRSALEDVMRRVGARPSRAKDAAAWAAEKAGRLKLNGHLITYSPLSRLLELEGLCLGIEGKLSLWRSLQALTAGDPRLAGVDLERLIDRASAQRRELEGHRVDAAMTALRPR